MSSADSHRLTILTPQEIDELYGLPRFTENDRQLYFDLSTPERAAIEVRTVSVGVYLALELGYFKAKRQFFTFEQDDVLGDLRYLLERYFPGKTIGAIKLPSRPTRFASRQTILDLFEYHLCDGTANADLEQKAQRIAALSTQPLYILRESLQHLTNQRVVAPQYSTLQDMSGRVVTYESRQPAFFCRVAHADIGYSPAFHAA